MSSKDDKIKPKSSTIANDTLEEPHTKKPKVVTGKKSKNKKNVRNHVQQNKHCRELHEKYKKKNKKKTLNQEDQDLNEKKEFQCKKCNKRFVSAASLSSHCSKFKH